MSSRVVLKIFSAIFNPDLSILAYDKKLMSAEWLANRSIALVDRRERKLYHPAFSSSERDAERYVER
jgi:hypothetical protein